MICLGIESTAHTFGIGIVKDKEILADSRDTFIPPKGWGIKPIDAAKHHEDVKEQVLKQSLEKAGLEIGDIDSVAFSQGAGLPPCLKVGMEFAKSLGKKVIPVCHQVAHLEIAKMLTKSKDPVYLYVSGGNTQVISLASGRYRVFGETMDVGIGNALDKFAREVGLQFPGGPKIEKLAKKGKYIELPYVVKGMDLSFSGILTSSLNKHKSGEKLEDVCFSFQETVFAMLVEVTERALAHTGKNEVILTGGVAANSRLRKMLEIMCKERGAKFFTCPREYSGDNGTMIAYNGLQVNKAEENLDIKPTLRTDDIDVTWKV